MPEENNQHRLGFHHGEVLLRLSNTYHTVLLMIVEAIQNAIDADAEKVFVGIDQKGAQVVVLDDGMGVDEAKFQQALMSVGKGVKRKGSLGRFGLGLISPLNKCHAFVITSLPVGVAHTNQWRFVGEDIKQQHEQVSIPFKRITRMPPVARPFVSAAKKPGALWRTMVHLTKITRDRAVSSVDIGDLEGQIRAKLGPEMRRKGVTAYVTIFDEAGQQTDRVIDPVGYTGEPLDVVEYDEPDCGTVRFELYRAPKQGGQRKGEVVVMQEGDNYPIRWKEFFTQAMGSGWLQDVKPAFDALGSGYFEGIIHVQNIELAPERTKFFMNDALRATYMVLNDWYEKVGKKHFEDAREERQEERYRELGQKSLEKLYALLETHAAFVSIAPELQASVTNERLDEPDESEPREKGSGTRRKKKPVVVKHPDEDEDERPKERDPRDNAHRGPIKLAYAYDRIPGQLEVWKFDASTGTLVFNISHPEWEHCDETTGKRSARHDKQVMHLQEWITLQVLGLLARHPEPAEFEAERWRIDEDLPRYVAAFILPR